MSGLKTTARWGSLFTVLLAAGVILAGCATGFNYSFDPAAGYTGLKSYNWVRPGTMGQTSDLVVKNFQYQADQVLEKKGFRKTAENPEHAALGHATKTRSASTDKGDVRQLRMLALDIRRRTTSTVPRGTGNGNTSMPMTASNDLENAVEGS